MPPEAEVKTQSFISELLSSPLNVALLGICGYLIYKILRERFQKPDPPPVREPVLPPMKRRDFTVEDLKPYDGRNEDGRILVAVNGKVFDMTRGKRFYGPDGPYGVFAGKDATRALATFSLTAADFKDSYDDVSDLSSSQMDSVREWEEQFKEKYDYVGKLLKPGEEPSEYSDNEEENEAGSSGDKSKSD
jgi:membrane-associated progesterone receptor component